MTAPTITPKPKPAWPKPQLVHDHAALFREPAYEDGQSYADQDHDADEGLED